MKRNFFIRPNSFGILLVVVLVNLGLVGLTSQTIVPVQAAPSTDYSSPSAIRAPRSIIVVTSAADSGAGTLRQALLTAVNGDTITFDPTVFPPATPTTITLTSVLPHLTQGNLTLDASNAGVILNGSGILTGTNRGFQVLSNGNVIKGFQIINFSSDGIYITVANNIIGGDRAVGTSPTGSGNLISGNTGNGIQIYGASALYNQVQGNYIGTNISGTVALPNAQYGVSLNGGASSNTIGGATSAERNIISYNNLYGVSLSDSGTVSNTIQNNWIGIDADSSNTLFIRDMVIANDGTLFLADSMRGIFKSTNGAASWQAVNTGLLFPNVDKLAVSPNFASDQRLWTTDWITTGMQLYTSTNAGATWVPGYVFTNGVSALQVSPNFAVDHTLLLDFGKIQGGKRVIGKS